MSNERNNQSSLVANELAKVAKNIGAVTRAIENVGVSPNVPDSQLEPANIVDVIDKLACCVLDHARATEKIALGIICHAEGMEKLVKIMEQKQNTCEKGIEP